MLFLLAAGWTVIYANRTVMFPLLSVIALQFSLSSADVGLLTGSYFFMYLLLQIPAGMLGDRFGMKRVMLSTYAIATVGVLGLGLFAGQYLPMLAFISLHGFGAGGLLPLFIRHAYVQNSAGAARSKLRSDRHRYGVGAFGRDDPRRRFV